MLILSPDIVALLTKSFEQKLTIANNNIFFSTEIVPMLLVSRKHHIIRYWHYTVHLKRSTLT